MAKRKKAPNATYTYVKDETAPAGSAKRGKTGGIKKEKTSSSPSGLVRPSTISAGRPRKPIEGFFPSASATVSASAESAGEAFNLAELAKQTAHADFTKKQEAEVSSNTPLQDRLPVARRAKDDPKRHSNRKTELEAAIQEAPYSKTEETPRTMGPLIAVRADKAAGPANVPVRGTRSSSAPASVDRSDALPESGVVAKRVKSKPQKNGGAVRSKKSGSFGAPQAKTAPGASSEIRDVRNEKDIADTKRRAKNRVAGGLRTTQLTPNTISDRSTARDNRNKRLRIKNAKRLEKGKTKLPGGIPLSASQAEASAAESAAAKAKVDITNVGGRDAGKFAYSHEALAQELSRTHFTDHSASDLMDYVKSTGSDMVAFHTHVRHAVGASQMIDVGPEGDRRKRSAGKITTWVKNPAAKIDPKTKKMAVNPVTKKTEPEFIAKSGYEGWHTVNARGGENGKENVKVWKKFEAPQGGINHLEYLNLQIHKFKENRAIAAKDTRDLNRARRRHRATEGLVDAMTPGTETKSTVKQPPKGRSGQYNLGTPRPEGEQGPLRRSGGFNEEKVVPEKPGFTEVKGPRNKRA